MSHTLGLLLTIVSVVTTCRALPDLHKQMSQHQLQSVFHVDSTGAVPAYEVVQLLQHQSDDDGAAATATRNRRRRSINVGEHTAAAAAAGATLKQSHHVKKDLSKNAYYSELKAAAAAAGPATANDASEKEHKVSFSAFGAHHNLTLRPTQGLFKGPAHAVRMWGVRSEPNATHGLDLEELFEAQQHTNEDVGEVYQDEANMAAILMRRHQTTGDFIMEGSIGHEMVIKPVPVELSPHRNQTHHIIYKREATPLDHLSDFAYMEPDDLAASEKLEKLQRRQRRAAIWNASDDDDQADALFDDEDAEAEPAAAAAGEHARSKRHAPYTIYPEVLVIVDYDGYRLHGGDNLQVKRYFISFWNGVDLRYRLLKGPRIRISIAGIIISRGRDATPYLERNRVGRDAIDSAAALTDMGKYLFRERRLPVYDIAVAITKYDMCRRRKGGRCTKGTAGFAYVGGACVVNKRLEKVNSVAIIEDTGGFSGIIVAAHEVGHLLGAVHDGSPPPSYLGGPGAQRCRWEDGYIMSDLRHTERGFRWSPCTVQSFHHFLNGDTATCLHNEPHEDGALGRSLPGTLLSLDAQCRRDRGTYACFKDERVCAQLFCFDAQTGYCVAYRPAAEGSACGNGLHCLDGRCTPLPSNGIPNYRLAYNNNNIGAVQTDPKVKTSTSVEDDEENDNDNDENDGSDEESAEEERDEQDNELVERERKYDNSVEETSLEVTDEAERARGTTNGQTPTTAKPMGTTTASARLAAQQIQANTNTPTTTTTTTQTTTRTHVGAFEYLARFLEQNVQWQHLLGTPLATAHNNYYTSTTTTTTTTTETPTTTSTSTIPSTTTPLSLPLPTVEQQNGAVVRTSTSRSVSSSVSSSRGSSTHGTVVESRLDGERAPSELMPKSRELTEHTETTQQHEQHQHQQHEQQRQEQTQIHEKPVQKKPNMFTNFPNEFRKQFQYYLNLLQRGNSNSNIKQRNYSGNNGTNGSVNSTENSSIHSSTGSSSRGLQQFSPSTTAKRESSKNSNYSATTATAAAATATTLAASSPKSRNNGKSNLDFGSTGQPNDADDDGGSNVESNEAIVKQKLVNWKAFPF